MSDILNDPELETRVRRAMHALADSHQPSPLRPSANVDPPHPPHRPHRHRSLAMAAAFALVVGGVVAVVAVANRDTALAPTDIEPSLPAPDGTPNADGDMEIDPGGLRFGEPLPDDVVAFIDDPSLPAPRVEEPQGTTLSDDGPIAFPLDDPPESVSVVAMDGAELLMRGTIIDLAPDTADFDGPTVDVGVDGARYVDGDRGAIVMPLETGELRVVGPDDFFAFGGGGPHIDAGALLAIARAVGTTPIDEVDSLPGFFVFRGSIGGRELDPIGYGAGITVRHGAGAAMSATITRLAEAPTALDLIAIANAVTRGSIASPTVGDVTLFDGEQFYIELVSPVDLLIVHNGAGVDDGMVAAIDLAPIDRLGEEFDGTVEASPPAPDPAPIDTARSSAQDVVALLEPSPVEPVSASENITSGGNWVAGIVAFDSIAEFDGDRFVALWTVLDTDEPWNPASYTGPAADIPGLQARWTTAEMTSLALPGPTGTRFVRPGPSTAGDAANLAVLVDDQPLDEVVFGADFVRIPTAERQIVTQYGPGEYEVVPYRVPRDRRFVSDQVALLFAADRREVTTHSAEIYSVELNPDQQIVVRVVDPTLVAVVVAPVDADPLAIGTAVVIRPLDESPVEIDRSSVLTDGIGEVVARNEADWGRWELRTYSEGDAQCWGLATRTPLHGETAAEPPFDVGGIGGVGSCWGPDEPALDPIVLCSAGGNSEAPVVHVVGVVEAGHTVDARLGGQPWPLALDEVDGWVAFYADTAAEPDTTFGLTVEIDGVRADC